MKFHPHQRERTRQQASWRWRTSGSAHRTCRGRCPSAMPSWHLTPSTAPSTWTAGSASPVKLRSLAAWPVPLSQPRACSCLRQTVLRTSPRCLPPLQTPPLGMSLCTFKQVKLRKLTRISCNFQAFWSEQEAKNSFRKLALVMFEKEHNSYPSFTIGNMHLNITTYQWPIYLTKCIFNAPVSPCKQAKVDSKHDRQKLVLGQFWSSFSILQRNKQQWP